MSERLRQPDDGVARELWLLRRQVDSLQQQLELTSRRLHELESAAPASRETPPPVPPATPIEPPRPVRQMDSQVDVAETEPVRPAAIPPPLPQPARAILRGSPPPGSDAPYLVRASRDRGFSLERSIGAHWTSWVGGLIVFLGVCFFLKYAWDQGWLRPSPQVRVLAAILFGAALLAVGEFLYRRSAQVLGA